jgi:hypothetical protein
MEWEKWFDYQVNVLQFMKSQSRFDIRSFIEGDKYAFRFRESVAHMKKFRDTRDEAFNEVRECHKKAGQKMILKTLNDQHRACNRALVKKMVELIDTSHKELKELIKNFDIFLN